MGRNHDVIKIANMFVKTTFSESKKRQITHKSAVYICIFLYKKSFCFSVKNVDVSRTEGSVT